MLLKYYCNCFKFLNFLFFVLFFSTQSVSHSYSREEIDAFYPGIVDLIRQLQSPELTLQAKQELLKGAPNGGAFTTQQVTGTMLSAIRKTPGYLERLLEEFRIDHRPVRAGLLDFSFVAFYQSIKAYVNPDNRPMTVLYGASGADLSSVLLSTNATHVVLADLSEFRLEDFRTIMVNMDACLRQHVSKVYLLQKCISGGSISRMDSMSDIEGKLAMELSALGVDLSRLKFRQLEDKSIEINFSWEYFNTGDFKEYKITIVQGVDITSPDAYPSVLRSIIEDGFDIYYQKAALSINSSYARFMPYIFQALKPNGYLMVNDYTSSPGSSEYPQITPDESLQSSENRGAAVLSEKLRHAGIDGLRLLCKIPHLLEKKDTDVLYSRFSDTLVSRDPRAAFPSQQQPIFYEPTLYWWSVAIRQKLEEVL